MIPDETLKQSGFLIKDTGPNQSAYYMILLGNTYIILDISAWNHNFGVCLDVDDGEVNVPDPVGDSGVSLPPIGS